MPFINVKLIEDVFTPEQKRRIVEELTDAMVATARTHAALILSASPGARCATRSPQAPPARPAPA